MQNLNIKDKTSFMCSFDISSLFTNVPLNFAEEVFIELMETATHSVEFSFNNELYQQAIWDLPWPIYFLGFHEERLFDCDQKPGVYFPYVNDTLSSFCPKQRKISLIKTLTHRALMICCESKLDSELEKLTKIFLENGYPEDVISVYIREKIGNFSADVKFGPQKCPVYLKLPWIGDSSLRFESQIKQAITNCFFAVNPRIVYSTNKGPSVHSKGVLSCHTKKFRCI